MKLATYTALYTLLQKAAAEALAAVICLVPNSRYCENVPLCSSMSAVKSPEITALVIMPRNALYKPISTFATSLGAFNTNSSLMMSTGLGVSTSSQELTVSTAPNTSRYWVKRLISN